MGKGDKRTKKGKRILSTWGVHRPRTDKNPVAPVAKTKKKKSAAKPKAKAEKKTEEKEEVVAKATPAKKAPVKKAESNSTDISSNTVAELKAMLAKVQSQNATLIRKNMALSSDSAKNSNVTQIVYSK